MKVVGAIAKLFREVKKYWMDDVILFGGLNLKLVNGSIGAM